MKEQTRKPKAEQQVDGGFGGPFDAAPSAAPSNIATVKCGQYCENIPVGGMTVRQVRDKYKSEFNIHDNAVSIINKKQVDDKTIIQEGQTLTFIHKSGEKGARV